MFNSVGLICILVQPACPEVIVPWPVLSYIDQTPHCYGAFAGLTKSWPIVKVGSARLNSAVPVVVVVAPFTEYHGGRIIVLPALCI